MLSTLVNIVPLGVFFFFFFLQREGAYNERKVLGNPNIIWDKGFECGQTSEAGTSVLGGVRSSFQK